MGGRGGVFREKAEKRGLQFGKKGRRKPSEKLAPAAINRLANTGSLEKMTRAFGEKHSNEDIEYGVQVDRNGYATHYYKGNGGSVSFSGDEANGNHFLHNHPKDGWGNFSGADLDTWASTGATGISAISRNKKTPTGVPEKAYKNRRAGTYQLTKTHAFRSGEFKAAIHTLKVSSNDYDRDLGSWLDKNQRKYGYKYSFTRARNRAD